MVRVAVLSDIHGNLAALRAVFDDVHRQGPDLIVWPATSSFTGRSPTSA
ncbi:MAG: metallophosphoesterase [Bacillota bacterium]